MNICRLLADDRLEKLGLFRVANGKMATPLAEDGLSLFEYRSKRVNEFVEQPIIEGLIAALKIGGFKAINHIGFCYKVASKEDEVKRIIHDAKQKRWHVYQEPSSDDADWIFVGDISEITNPLIELLPHEGQNTDEWVDYWLPHIQFDGVTYIQRVNLGCLEGINLMLDISTNNRDINYRKSWNKLA